MTWRNELILLFATGSGGGTETQEKVTHFEDFIMEVLGASEK